MKISFLPLNGLRTIVLLTFLINFHTIAQPNHPRDPGEAKLIYSDLENFIDAYRELETNADTLKVLQVHYFDRGSAGLEEFIKRHGLTPELLKDALSENPERYALLPGFLEKIDETEAEFRSLMKDYHKIMSDAIFAPTYLLVGANRGIGQASLVGQLITVTRVSDDKVKLQKLITHELSHLQQAITMGGQKYASLYATENNMLDLCLREGGAEFITSLVLGEITQTKALDYLDNHPTRLKKQFLADLEAQNKEFWLWASLEQKSHPQLMGYAMGYRICDHFYDKADDKRMAIQQILMMGDAEAFLQYSGYFD
jgi:hypothetical protein